MIIDYPKNRASDNGVVLLYHDIGEPLQNILI